MTLAIIICGKNKPYKWIQPISNYHFIPDELKTHFLGDNPCIYTETDGSQHTCEFSEIVYADIEKAEARLGDNYKIESSYLMTAYPKYIPCGDYIGAFQRIDAGGFPVYRFPGGDRIADDIEITHGSFDRAELLEVLNA